MNHKSIVYERNSVRFLDSISFSQRTEDKRIRIDFFLFSFRWWHRQRNADETIFHLRRQRSCAFQLIKHTWSWASAPKRRPPEAVWLHNPKSSRVEWLGESLWISILMHEKKRNEEKKRSNNALSHTSGWFDCSIVGKWKRKRSQKTNANKKWKKIVRTNVTLTNDKTGENKERNEPKQQKKAHENRINSFQFQRTWNVKWKQTLKLMSSDSKANTFFH